MKVGDIIQLPTLEEMGYKGRTVQSQSIRFNRRCSDKECIKFLEGKTIVAGEVIVGTQIFKIKRD